MSSQLSMSSDGTVLAALGGASMSLSGSATVVMVNYASATGTPSCSSQAFPAAGGASIWCGIDPSFLEPQLSPDGTLIASHATGSTGASSNSTDIYKNGVLQTSVPGWATGWLDNGRFLAITLNVGINYTGSVIYSSTGTVLAKPALPDIYTFNVVTTNSIYSPELNQILSLTTGSPTWESGNALLSDGAIGVSMGAIAGSQVVFTSGALVLAQPY
jgi:hypothetical protein